MTDVLASCYEISQAFTPDLPVPERGFAASPAFKADGPLTDRLRDEHDAATDGLYYGTEQAPTFDDVLSRVLTNRDLLDMAATT